MFAVDLVQRDLTLGLTQAALRGEHIGHADFPEYTEVTANGQIEHTQEGALGRGEKNGELLVRKRAVDFG